MAKFDAEAFRRSETCATAYNSQVRHRWWVGLWLVLCVAQAADLDLSKARLALPTGLSKRESKAVEMLRDEVQKRTRIQLPVTPAAGVPTIAISRGRGSAEGYSLHVAGSQVSIAANDERGM